MRIADCEKAFGLYRITVAILSISTCICPAYAFAWSSNTHFEMANDTESFFPDHMRLNLSKVVCWISEPDRNRIVSHCDIGACAHQIKKLAKSSIEMLQKKEKVEMAFANMGKGTHYIQDLNCPHHGIGYYKQGQHESFEQKIYGSFWNDSDFDGFHYIVDYKIFAYNAARFSKRYIKYCDKLLYKDSDYFERYKKLVTPLYEHTVNDSIDYWLTILYDGLGEEKYNELGLPPKVGTRAENKLRYPKVKSLWE